MNTWMGLPEAVRAETGVLKPKGSQARVHKAPEPERGAQTRPEPMMPGPSQRTQEIR